MKFHGLQKMTLLDYPGHVAATVFTGGCNFRCPFCHNALLVTRLGETETYSEEDILRFLETRRGLLDGICLTGGEPLLNVGVAGFLRRVRDLGFAVKLDTNGSFPNTLRDLVSDGLVDYVAVDIKNRKEKYAETVGVPGFDTSPVEETVSFLLSGTVDFEFRTTVVKELHDEEDIRAIAEWIKGTPRYFLQQFTDSGDLIGSGYHAHDTETMKHFRDVAAEVLSNVSLRGI